jgi:ABC-type multidrug transport system ATPase subunit
VAGLTTELTDGVVALLGRNGAGKSTLLSIVAGIARETSGSLEFRDAPLGTNRRALRAAVTLLPQDLALDPDVSARTLVRHLLALRGRPVSTVETWLAEFGLAGTERQPIRTFSGGMRQRVGLAYAFAADTPVLVLDEPTRGLDPWERLRLARQIAVAAYTKLVVYSTHVVSDVESVAARVLVLDGGRLIHDGTPETLRAAAPPIWLLDNDKADLGGGYERATVTAITRMSDGRYRIRCAGEEMPERAKPVEPTLTDAYLALTGQATGC